MDFSEIVKVGKKSKKSRRSTSTSNQENVVSDPRMENLINVVNRLQDVFSTVGAETIQLPQIVAIGGQSTGKSSVIESIVGRSFLPRGTGIVTRCPLILQLIYTPLDDREHRSEKDGTSNIEEFGKFRHNEEKVFTDFDEICKEIEDETDRLAGTNKGICHDPITLKIYSKNVATLTLVDLPGTTKVPVGDQPKNIEDQIKDLVFKYIENPNSIILAVTSANTDIATSESLKFAKEVDPEGERTLAVLTKLDLMDAGTDAKDMLYGRVIPVKLGIIGVVNRSQQDVIDKKKIPESLNHEAAFLQKKYPALASTNGTPYLAKTLHQILIRHIHNNLPDLRDRVRNKMTENEALLDEYGDEVADKGRTLIQIITKFGNAYNSSIEGNVKHIELGNIYPGGAEIYCRCFEIYRSELDAIDPLMGLNEKDIWKAVKFASGIEPPIFVSEDCFKLMVRKQIGRFKKPSIECLDDVHEKMRDLISQSLKKDLALEMGRFPKIFSRILNILTKYLSKCAIDTKKMIENMLEIELTYINTQHPEFRKALHELDKPEDEDDIAKTSKWLSNISLQNQDGKKPSMATLSKDLVKTRMTNHVLTADERKDVDKIKALITSYFNIIKSKLLDSVPKAVMHFLVFPGKDNVREELIHQMYVKEMLDDLLLESDQVTVKRREATDMLKALTRANEIICEIGEIQI